MSWAQGYALDNKSLVVACHKPGEHSTNAEGRSAPMRKEAEAACDPGSRSAGRYLLYFASQRLLRRSGAFRIWSPSLRCWLMTVTETKGTRKGFRFMFRTRPSVPCLSARHMIEHVKWVFSIVLTYCVSLSIASLPGGIPVVPSTNEVDGSRSLNSLNHNSQDSTGGMSTSGPTNNSYDEDYNDPGKRAPIQSK